MPRKARYDRSKILAKARRAAGKRSRRQRRKAVGLYRRILEVEPENVELRRRVASLCAKAGERQQAVDEYRLAAQEMVEKGFLERAVGIYREATSLLPDQARAWKALAQLEMHRGRKPDAKAALLEGRKHFRSRKTRGDAASLLLMACRIDPKDLAIHLDLAKQLARIGRGAEANQVFDQMVALHRRKRRKIRWCQFQLAPNGRNAATVLRALVGLNERRAVA